MRRVSMSLVAAAAIASASPAFSQAINDQTGADLNTKIYASQDPTNVAPNTGPVVYGNTSTGAGHDVAFYGYTQFNPALTLDQNTALYGTDLHITDGGGFAQINDADFDSKTPSLDNVFAIVMDAPDFTAYEYTIMLNLQGNATSSMYVYYWLTGGSGWIQAINSPLLTGGSANQFILDGDSLLPGQSYDKVLIYTPGADIFEIKQNSINLASAVRSVPEPGTWALMLLGFAGVGMTLRSRRRKDAHLAQLA